MRTICSSLNLFLNGGETLVGETLQISWTANDVKVDTEIFSDGFETVEPPAL